MAMFLITSTAVHCKALTEHSLTVYILVLIRVPNLTVSDPNGAEQMYIMNITEVQGHIR